MTPQITSPTVPIVSTVQPQLSQSFVQAQAAASLGPEGVVRVVSPDIVTGGYPGVVTETVQGVPTNIPIFIDPLLALKTQAQATGDYSAVQNYQLALKTDRLVG